MPKRVNPNQGPNQNRSSSSTSKSDSGTSQSSGGVKRRHHIRKPRNIQSTNIHSREIVKVNDQDFNVQEHRKALQAIYEKILAQKAFFGKKYNVPTINLTILQKVYPDGESDPINLDLITDIEKTIKKHRKPIVIPHTVDPKNKVLTKDYLTDLIKENTNLMLNTLKEAQPDMKFAHERLYEIEASLSEYPKYRPDLDRAVKEGLEYIYSDFKKQTYKNQSAIDFKSHVATTLSLLQVD